MGALAAGTVSAFRAAEPRRDECEQDEPVSFRDEVIGGVRYINVSTPTAAAFSRDRTAGLLDLDRGQAALTPIDLKA